VTTKVEMIPFWSSRGIEHPTIHGAGHFIPEDGGEELARHIVDFLG
jgi:haloalkane dehalogenase